MADVETELTTALGALPPAAQSFREEFVARAVEAASTTPRRMLTLAGERIALDVVDPRLERLLMPALEHHDAPPGDFTVRFIVWTGEVPAFPWGQQHIGRNGAIVGLSEGAVRAVVGPEEGSLVLWDIERQIACCWFAGPEAVHSWDRSAPLRTALHLALSSPTRRLVHAAAIGRNRRGVLLAGRSGSGKSTTTLACLRAGLEIAGDDYVVIQSIAGELRIASLYRSIKIETRSVEPGRGGLAGESNRRVVFYGNGHPGRIAPELDVWSILLPRVVGGSTSRLSRAGPAAALRAIAPSTLLQAPHDEHPGLGPIVALVRQTPCFHLELGDDLGVSGVLQALAG